MTEPSSPRRSPRRSLLPVLGDGHTGGNRSSLTCVYRCGDACAYPEPNTSDNPYFGDVAAPAMSRRALIGAAGAGALVVSSVALTGASPAAATTVVGRASGRGEAGAALTFAAVPPNTLDAVVVPNGYDHRVLVRWGDPVLPGAPAFDVDDQTPQAQAKQFGYNCDYVWFMPLPGRTDRALLVVNHEYSVEPLMFRGYTDGESATRQQARTAQMAHGLSIVQIHRDECTDGDWRLSRPGSLNRRITADTPILLTGPAAGSRWLRTRQDPSGTLVRGTLNNCAGGTTPWGTILTGEENFNQYFAQGDRSPAADRARLERYGISTTTARPAGYRGWDRFDDRFDVSRTPQEPNRFGWVVEVDPYDPDFVPRKRTALGRFKHEGADISLTADGRVVAYMGDDERFDYMYKFVSAERYRPGRSRRAREHNLRLLDEGTLYVATFAGDSGRIDGTGALPEDGAFDGTGRWLPLASHERSFVPGMSVAEVFVFTRQAADQVGATKMDRPEEVERDPRTGRVYVALTNNTARTPGQVDEANPRPSNKHGQVLELTERGGDGAATRFTWTLPIVCGDPEDPSTYFAGYDKTQVSPISCPDNVGFDAAGNLWLATDGNALGSNDGFFAVPLEGPERGHLKQFLTVPRGAEACGLTFTPDMRTLFVAVQHPGEVTGASLDTPASTWPDGEFARPSVATVYRTASGSKRIGA